MINFVLSLAQVVALLTAFYVLGGALLVAPEAVRRARARVAR